MKTMFACSPSHVLSVFLADWVSAVAVRFQDVTVSYFRLIKVTELERFLSVIL